MADTAQACPAFPEQVPDSGDAAVLMRALSMVGQRLDHPTLPHPTVATCLDHAPQLSAQSHELPDSTLDLGHVSTGDAVHLRAGPVRLGGQSQQLANPSSRA
jgi:hypothetical protein